MNSEFQDLLERARRHGLQRESNIDRWTCPDLPGFVVAMGPRGRWWWLLGKVSQRDYHDAIPHYRTEAHALRAALDWLDMERPSRAWAPDPGGFLGESLRTLQRATTGPVTPDWRTREAAETALRLLRRISGPLEPLSQEELLQVALDLSIDQGQLSPALRRALIRGIRAWPEVVPGARIAVWLPDVASFDDWSLLDVGAVRGYADAIGRAWEEDGRWHWTGYAAPGGSGEAQDCATARAACANACAGWVVIDPSRPDLAPPLAPLETP